MARLADFFPTILVSLVVAFASAPLFIRVATKAGMVDIPDARPYKWHDTATPLAGGLVLAVAILVSILTVAQSSLTAIRPILAAGAIVLLWGLWDDRASLPVWAKLVGQILAAITLWLGGILVHLFSIEWLNLLITVFWVVGMLNAFNFIDSMDGLALGLGGIGAAFFMLVTVDSQQPSLAFLCAALVGGTVGSAFYNVTPAKMFIGDSGSQLLGLLLLAVGMAYVPIGLDKAVSWFTPILVLGVPIFNITLVVFSRVWRRVKFYEARRDHLAHRLVDLGLDRSRTVIAMHITAVVLGLVAFIALKMSPVGATLLFGVVVAVGLIAIVLLERARSPAQS